MRRLNTRLIAVTAIPALLLAACSLRLGPPPEPTVIFVTATPEAGPTLPPAVSGDQPDACQHLVWPLRDGASWSYHLITDSGTTAITLTSTVGQFGMTLAAGGQERSLICGEDVLAGLPPLPVGHPALGEGIVGTNPAGEYLPAPSLLLPLGMPATWEQETDASGTIRLPVAEGADALSISGGKIVLIQEAEELDVITVPAGEFRVLPVHQDVLFDIQVQMPDGGVQGILISASARHYYAEGVGLVRANYDGGTVSTPGGAWPLQAGWVLELVSMTLPG